MAVTDEVPVVFVSDKVVLSYDKVYTLSDGRRVRIGKGFEFDGASIPRFLWRVVGHPYTMPLLVCALLHDALYASELIDRKEADNQFLICMCSVGITWFKRRCVWLGVRAGGGAVWKKHTRDSVELTRNLYVRFEDETDCNAQAAD